MSVVKSQLQDLGRRESTCGPGSHIELLLYQVKLGVFCYTMTLYMSSE
jgi:hypothetical protein